MSLSDFNSDSEGDDGLLSPVQDSDSDSDPGMDNSGRLRLRPGIALEGEEYEGKKTSRMATFDEELDPEDTIEGDFFEGAPGWSRGIGDAIGSSDEGEEENKSSRGLLGAQDEELDALNAEYEKLREEEEQGLEILRAQDTGDLKKAKAVRNQKNLWDNFLGFRILLSKLTEGNRLPRKSVKDVMSQENDKVREGFSKLAESAVQALTSLMDLETALIDNNAAISETFSSKPIPSGDGEGASPVMDRETIADKPWKEIDDLYGKIVPYRDDALDRWQRRTQIISGAVAKVKLRAFNQNVSQQVASAMRDSSRVISRTMLKRGSVHVLGELPEVLLSNGLENGRSGNAGSDSIAETAALRDDGDPETFDDSEFYAQLLRELIETKDPSAAVYTTRYQNKKRKVVDRRASKGRKLRYNVFEPLLNFMAAKPMVLPPMAEKLYGNLLGQKPKPSRLAAT